MKRLPKSLSSQSFKEAWKDGRDSKTASVVGAPGVDGVRAQVFAGELASQISQIRSDLQNGRYKFNALRLAPIRKPSGGYRIIAIPTVRDRLVQRTILRALEADPRFQAESPIAYGFAKGRSLADAQRQSLAHRQHKPWMLQADIVKFFDRIDRAKLEALIARKVRGKSLSSLLLSAIRCEIESSTGKSAAIVKEACIQTGVGLRQGMPVSPMLSNLLLKSFDEALLKRHMTAIRYADDVAIFGSNRKELEVALSFIQEKLSELHLEIPELGDGSKTIIKSPSESVEFLGVEIKRAEAKYILTAPAKKLEAIEADMRLAASLEECVKNSRTISQVGRSLDSFIIGHNASMAVLDNPKPFIERLEAAKKRALTALMVEIIGQKAVAMLDAERRAVLGLEKFEESKSR
jgi:RNA-directed DNA polymerase